MCMCVWVLVYHRRMDMNVNGLLVAWLPSNLLAVSVRCCFVFGFGVVNPCAGVSPFASIVVCAFTGLSVCVGDC